MYFGDQNYGEMFTHEAVLHVVISVLQFTRLALAVRVPRLYPEGRTHRSLSGLRLRNPLTHHCQGYSYTWCAGTVQDAMAVLLLAKAATGAELVRVRSCYDGDTCTLNTGEKVRLACFDTPELRGRSTGPMVSLDAGIAARDHLRQMVVGREASIHRHTTDRYGRTVATLFIDGLPVGAEMVRSGHGVVMPRYAHQCSWSR